MNTRKRIYPITPDIVERFDQSMLTGPSPVTVNAAIDRELGGYPWWFMGAREQFGAFVLGFSTDSAGPPTMLLYMNGARLFGQRMLRRNDALHKVHVFSMGRDRLVALALRVYYAGDAPDEPVDMFVVPPPEDETNAAQWVLRTRYFTIKSGVHCVTLIDDIDRSTFQHAVDTFAVDAPYNKPRVPESHPNSGDSDELDHA